MYMTVRTGCKLPLPFQKLGSRSVWNFHNSYVLQRLTYWGEQSCPFSRILCNTLQEPICLLIQLLLFPLHHGVKGAILKVARIAGGLSGGNLDSNFWALFWGLFPHFSRLKTFLGWLVDYLVRIWIGKCICTSCWMYLTKLLSVFVQIEILKVARG